MTYRIVHRTEYRYRSAVSSSYGEAHLHPREAPGQRCYSAALSIEPFPEDYRERRDFFGNRVANFNVREPHECLVVTATSVVDVRGRHATGPLHPGRPWESVRDRLHADPGPEVIEARQFVLESPAVPASPEAAEYALGSFLTGRPVLEALADLTHRIHEDFEYSPGATKVGTTVSEVFRDRAGVCQDFAHVALAGVRSLGLAGRYVSGYLETMPPPGTPRLQGADMSHAWLSVFVPDVGWVDIDPTNDQFVTNSYITVAWGRDYNDVPPLKGVIFTEVDEHELKVTVDVMPVADDDPALVGA